MVVYLWSVIVIIFLCADGARSEVTYTVQRTDSNSLIFTFQRRQAQPQTRVTPQPQPEVRAEYSGPPVMQVTPRPQTNPSDGPRTQAIESRGGVAATQECGGYIEITNMSGQCNELEYDRDFLRLIQTDGLQCARNAAQAAFGFVPTQIKLRTGEGQVSATRRSSNGKVSTHAVGRALDIFEVDIYNGSAHNSVKMHRNYMDRRGHRTFYTQFGDCWRETVINARGGVGGTCGSGCLDFNYNSAHWDHMHISLPPTNANRAAHGINCT